MIVILGMIVPVYASIPGYSLSKSASKDTVVPGETITFSITMSNDGYVQHGILQVNDDWLNLPGFPNNGIPFTQPGTSSCSWLGGNDPVICLFDELPLDGSITVSFPFTISPANPGTYANSAYIAMATDIKAQTMITVLPSIKVITPDGDQTWQRGTAYTITWTQTGLSDTDVKILLMKGYGYNEAATIANPVSATSGSFTWTVPSDIASGTDYWVKIVSLTYPNVDGDMWSGWITIPDITPPTVMSTNPADDTMNVPVDIERITVTFSEKIVIVASDSGLKVFAPGDNQVLGTQTMNPDKDTLIFTPSSPLAYNTQYTIMIFGISDYAGNPAELYIGHFTTVPPNAVPTVTSVTIPVVPVAVGSRISPTGIFTDPDSGDAHTAIWTWADGNVQTAPIPAGDRTVTLSHAYATAGIYTIALTVKDNKGGVSDPFLAPSYIVIYDPKGGYVAGSGTITSPTGAYVANPSMTGPATFGFTSKYSTSTGKKTSTTPVGTTAFQFKLGNLDFRSTKYDWMVVSGPKVIYKGTGTINKKGTYMFMLSAIDGQIQGGNGIDRFRIKIVDKTSGKLVYDNLIGAADDANPTTVLTSGSITITKP